MDLVALLELKDPRGEPRELYRDRYQKWAITYYGPVEQGDATRLLRSGRLYPTYIGNLDVFWLEPYSIDLEASRVAWIQDPNTMVVHQYPSGEVVTIPWHRRQLQVPRRPRRNVPTSRRQLAADLYAKHGNQRLVAQIMGCSHQNVSLLLKNAAKAQ